jgi:uncharacterized protein YraI
MLVVLSAASAAAEPATVISTVNLRSGAGTTNEIVGKIPSGSLVETANCGEWCEVEWQGKKGFAIATSLDRTGRVPARRTVKRSDPFATDVAAPNSAPKSVLDTPRSSYEAPERAYGPYMWSYGPASGPYKRTSGLGYRGRW